MHKFGPMPERFIEHTYNESKNYVVKAWSEDMVKEYVLQEIATVQSKLDWVIENEPQFDVYGKWYMKWWRHFPLSSDEISGWWVASGNSKMECIENAMSGNCSSMD